MIDAGVSPMNDPPPRRRSATTSRFVERGQLTHHGILLFDPRGVLRLKLEHLRARLEELGSSRIEPDDGTWYWDLKPDLRPGEVVTL